MSIIQTRPTNQGWPLNNMSQSFLPYDWSVLYLSNSDVLEMQCLFSVVSKMVSEHDSRACASVGPINLDF